jgi:hypothetical protein
MERIADHSSAAVACVALAQKYVLRPVPSNVAVVNFSSESHALPATQDIDKVVDKILEDQTGNTLLDLDVVRKTHATLRPGADVHIITDAGISNINDVLNYLASVGGRPNLWLIVNGGEPEGLETLDNRIQLHRIENVNDLPKQVIAYGVKA